jgi:hypothetical protein
MFVIYIYKLKIKLRNKGGMCHAYGLAIFTLKSILRQKKNLWKLNQIFHHSQNMVFQKFLQKKPKILQDITTLLYLTNLKFQHKPKLSSFRNPHIKIRPNIT